MTNSLSILITHLLDMNHRPDSEEKSKRDQNTYDYLKNSHEYLQAGTFCGSPGVPLRSMKDLTQSPPDFVRTRKTLR